MIDGGSVRDAATSWRGDELAADPASWTRRLTAFELADLIELARPVARSDDLRAAIDEAVWAVPESIRELGEAVHTELLHGRGFILLRGLPVHELDRRTTAAAYMLLGSQIGGFRPQNADGHLLGHVKDVGREVSDPNTRIYQTNERQGFHTDSADAVGLLCLRPADAGGLSQLASAATAFGLVCDRRPDLAPLLFEPVATDRRGELNEGDDPWFEIPVLTTHEGFRTVIYQRTYIDAAQRFDGAPKLSVEHRAALDLWDEVLNEPGVAVTMDLEPGDIQFVHNHDILHDRTAFTDNPDPEQRRHLMRLWLTLEGDRPLHPWFEQRYGSIAVGDRGGIPVDPDAWCVPLDV